MAFNMPSLNTKSPQQLTEDAYNRNMLSVMDTKGTSLIGSGANTMKPAQTSFKSVHVNICANARAAVVEKQYGADPSLPGPGQYINPLTEGRNSNGEVKAILSTQKSIPSAKFAGPSVPRYNTRSMAKAGAEKEPGPGQYVNTSNRGPDGEVKEILSTQKNARSTVWFRKGPPRGAFNGSLATPGPGAYLVPTTVQSNQKGTHGVRMGRPRSACDATRKPKFLEISRRSDVTPGPGHYIDPMKEGRNVDGEIKALLSNQISVKTVKFGGRPSSAGAYRSMAKPNSHNEPGPGQYVDPLKEGRAANGEVWPDSPLIPIQLIKIPYNCFVSANPKGKSNSLNSERHPWRGVRPNCVRS